MKNLFILCTILIFKMSSAQASNDFIVSDVIMNGSIAQIFIQNRSNTPQSYEFKPSLGCQETFPMGCRGRIIKVDHDAAEVIGVDEIKALQINMAEAFGYEANVLVEIEANDQTFFTEY